MSNYRRLYIPGATYFFTVVTYNRQPILCSDQAIARLREAFRRTMEKYPFYIHGLVVLPDHLHCVLQFPQNDFDFSKRWRVLKHYFSTGMKMEANHRREKSIWQRRFWEHCIRDENDLHRHLNYIYYNPVKHGYVSQPRDWVYSTFKRDVAKGFYDLEWGGD